MILSPGSCLAHIRWLIIVSQIVKNKEHMTPILKECQGLEPGIRMPCEVGLLLSNLCICFKILSALHQ